MRQWSFSSVRELIGNHKPFFPFQQGLILVSEHKKEHFFESAQRQKAISGIYLTRRQRPEALEPGLEICKFQPRFIKGIFECTSWLNVSVFFFGMIGVFERESHQNYYVK
jgi:hypothetical protein